MDVSDSSYLDCKVVELIIQNIQAIPEAKRAIPAAHDRCVIETSKNTACCTMPEKASNYKNFDVVKGPTS